MNKEIVIYIIEVILMISLLFMFIPKSKIPKAIMAFLFTQIIAWPLGLIVANYRLIEYPIRLFSYANKAHFTFEFFLFPSISTLFTIKYPEKKNALIRFMYYFYYCTSLTIVEVVQERYTNIIKYIHWTWYVTWITMFITFYTVRELNKWFFKKCKIINN